MKKVFLSLLVMVCAVATASAVNFTVDGLTYQTKSGTIVRVTSGSDYATTLTGELTIPATVAYNGTTYTVDEIGYNAFRACNGLTSVILPEGIKTLSLYAFYNCENLASINMPSTLTSIQPSAFQGCKSLASITIPAAVNDIPYNGQIQSQNSPFLYCDNLKTIVVESGNTKYDSRDNCNAIVETATNKLIYACNGTTIPSTVIVGRNAFRGCIITDVVVPEGVTTIEQQAFNYCGQLKNLSLPSTLTTIGDWAFQGCSSLESIVVAEGNTVYDSRENCNAIIVTNNNKLIVGSKNTIIPASVVTIGDNAFKGSSITEVIIPEGVTTIEYYAFNECDQLKTVSLPSTLTSIGYGAFQANNSLADIYAYPHCADVTLGDEIWEFMDSTLWTAKDCNLHVYPADYEDYKKADQWKEFNVIDDLGEATTNVYILGEIGTQTWAPNAGVKMERDAQTGLYTAAIECIDADNNGYDFFSFTTELAENNDQGGWDYIAPYRFGAVSEGDFLVSDDMLGIELTLEANGDAFQIPAGKYNLTLNYTDMKLKIEKAGMRGDANGDGTVDVNDVTTTINYILSKNPNPFIFDNANVNGDEKVDVMDVTLIINIILGVNQ